MANREAKERNSASKGKTGPATVRQRKKKGQKARPHKAATTKGKLR